MNQQMVHSFSQLSLLTGIKCLCSHHTGESKTPNKNEKPLMVFGVQGTKLAGNRINIKIIQIKTLLEL